MTTRQEALAASSPTIWGLASIGALATLGAVAVVVWNVVERVRG